MEALGFNLRQEAVVQTLTTDVLKSSESEGEKLDRDQVGSSIARRPGMGIVALKPADRHMEGVVEMMLDATRRFGQPLSAERAFSHGMRHFSRPAAGGMTRIRTGVWRDGRAGPIRLFPARLEKNESIMKPPKAGRLDPEMYYDILERTQKGTMDVTPWLDWFLGCLGRAIDGAGKITGAVLAQGAFLGARQGCSIERASTSDHQSAA